MYEGGRLQAAGCRPLGPGAGQACGLQPAARSLRVVIAFLRGRLLEKHPNRVIVDVQGVGYEVQVPVSSFYGMAEAGGDIALRVHTHVREDTIALFGFSTALELQLFERLIAVSGIGPKLALAVLSGIEPDDLIHAIQRADVVRLTAIPGVGKKTAERIVLELKDRLTALAQTVEAVAGQFAARRPRVGAAESGVPSPGAREGRRCRAERGRQRRVRGGAPAHLEAPVPIAPGQRTGPAISDMSDRLVTPARADDDVQYEAGLRPRRLDDYIGQDRVRANLQVSIAAAAGRGEALDHVLLYGPPGLGKTTLAYVIANELGVPIRATAGPVLERPGDLAAILTNLGEREVLFIDEIHRMPPAIEEILYPAMEDYELDIIIGQGPGARSVKVPVQPFTLIGATTRAGLLTSPLRARFGIVHRLDFYEQQDIEEIVRRSARILGVTLETAAASELAKRARGTPRIAQPAASPRARLCPGARRWHDHA